MTCAPRRRLFHPCDSLAAVQVVERGPPKSKKTPVDDIVLDSLALLHTRSVPKGKSSSKVLKERRTELNTSSTLLNERRTELYISSTRLPLTHKNSNRPPNKSGFPTVVPFVADSLGHVGENRPTKQKSSIVSREYVDSLARASAEDTSSTSSSRTDIVFLNGLVSTMLMGDHLMDHMSIESKKSKSEKRDELEKASKPRARNGRPCNASRKKTSNYQDRGRPRSGGRGISEGEKRNRVGCSEKKLLAYERVPSIENDDKTGANQSERHAKNTTTANNSLALFAGLSNREIIHRKKRKNGSVHIETSDRSLSCDEDVKPIDRRSTWAMDTSPSVVSLDDSVPDSIKNMFCMVEERIDASVREISHLAASPCPGEKARGTAQLVDAHGSSNTFPSPVPQQATKRRDLKETPGKLEDINNLALACDSTNFDSGRRDEKTIDAEIKSDRPQKSNDRSIEVNTEESKKILPLGDQKNNQSILPSKELSTRSPRKHCRSRTGAKQCFIEAIEVVVNDELHAVAVSECNFDPALLSSGSNIKGLSFVSFSQVRDTQNRPTSDLTSGAPKLSSSKEIIRSHPPLKQADRSKRQSERLRRSKVQELSTNEAHQLNDLDIVSDHTRRQLGRGGGSSENRRMYSRRSQRARSVPKRFGYDDSCNASDSEDSIETAPVASKETRPKQTIKSVPRPPKAAASIPEDDEPKQVWTSFQLEKLKIAHAAVEPSSNTFWTEVSTLVEGKTAAECREKWFSQMTTPAQRARNNGMGTRMKKPATVQVEEDDLFNSTPMRNSAPVSASIGLAEIDLGSAIKFEMDFSRLGKKTGEDQDMKVGYKTYIQGMRRDVTRELKRTKKQKKKSLKALGRVGTLTEHCKLDGVDMNVRLSPGGTLKINSQIEYEDDIYDDDSCAEEEFGSI